MNLIRKIFYFLCPAAFPLYNMGGGGGGSESSGTENTTTTPWEPSIPYLKQGLAEAQRLYQTSGNETYQPFNSVAQFNGDQLAAQNGLLGYVNSKGTQDFMNTATGTVNNLLAPQMSSDPGVMAAGGNLGGYLSNNTLMDPNAAVNRMAYGETLNPYTKQNVDNTLQGMMTGFQNNTLTGMRRGAIGNRSYGSSRNSLAEGMAASDLQQKMHDTSASMWENAYNTQEANRLSALGMGSQYTQNRADLSKGLLGSAANNDLSSMELGLSNYSNALNTPLSLLSVINQVGTDRQNMNQLNIADATNRWNASQNAPWDKLQKYRDLVYGTPGGQRSSTYNSMTQQQLPGTSTASSIMGGALQLGGLLGGLKGLGGSSAPTTGGGMPGYMPGISNNSAFSNLGNSWGNSFASLPPAMP